MRRCQQRDPRQPKQRVLLLQTTGYGFHVLLVVRLVVALGAGLESDAPVLVKLVVGAELRDVLFYRSGTMHLRVHLKVSLGRHTIEDEAVYRQAIAPPR